MTVVAAVWSLASLLPRALVDAANPPAPLQVPGGARVGVVNLLDAEVTHFHTSPQIQTSYLKTYAVGWNVSAMLTDAVRERLTQLGLVAVPLAAGDALSRAREDCFLQANLTKSLAKDCAALYGQLATAEHLSALIVLGPGLNNSEHAQATRRKELPEYLRGWCVLSGEGANPIPTLLNLTELLLIGMTPKGAVLMDREWGGSATQPWVGFAAPDLKALSESTLNPLQPLYAGLLKQQTSALFEHLQLLR